MKAGRVQSVEDAAVSAAFNEFKQSPLTKQEMNDLLNACRTGEEKLVIWVLLDTGMRLAEFCGLTKHNIDWQSHKIKVLGKGRKVRIVPMSDRIQKILEARIAMRDGVLLEPRTVQRIVRRVANHAGISRKVSPHTLRHSFAVACLERGVSLPALQKLLGHSNLATTAIYLDKSNEEAVREFREKW